MFERVKKFKNGCEQCTCKESCAGIPVSLAVTAERADYVSFLCGQACYEKWQTRHKRVRGNKDE